MLMLESQYLIASMYSSGRFLASEVVHTLSRDSEVVAKEVVYIICIGHGTLYVTKVLIIRILVNVYSTHEYEEALEPPESGAS